MNLFQLTTSTTACKYLCLKMEIRPLTLLCQLHQVNLALQVVLRILGDLFLPLVRFLQFSPKTNNKRKGTSKVYAAYIANKLCCLGHVSSPEVPPHLQVQGVLSFPENPEDRKWANSCEPPPSYTLNYSFINTSTHQHSQNSQYF